MGAPDRAWNVKVPVQEIPEAGRHFDLAADEQTRAAIALSIGVRALPRLVASLDVTRRGRDGVHVTGHVSATVGQDCVVTLDPLESKIDEDVDVAFTSRAEEAEDNAASFGLESRDPPELLEDGTVDLGVVAIEFLVLGIDPYPRKPDVLFDPPETADPGAHPFAALAAFKKGQSEGNQ